MTFRGAGWWADPDFDNGMCGRTTDSYLPWHCAGFLDFLDCVVAHLDAANGSLIFAARAAHQSKLVALMVVLLLPLCRSELLAFWASDSRSRCTSTGGEF